jgi:hypothetical protein
MNNISSTLIRVCVVKGPAADTTDAPQPWGLLCNPVMKIISLFVFSCNGAPVEWNWQGKTEVLGEKPVPVPRCPPQIPHGLTRDGTLTSSLQSCSARETTRMAELLPVLCKSDDLVMCQWYRQWPWRQTERETGDLFNDAVKCYDYKQRTGSMEDEWNMKMECWWNDNDIGRVLWEKLPQWHFVCKPHTYWSGIEFRPSGSEA